MEEVKFPTLYKKTSTGAIQFWDISANESRVSDTAGDETDLASTIVTEYGQMGTQNPQKTFDRIRSGKNIGKKNETTPFQQAVAEAKAKWEKQLKKGYTQTLSAAQSDGTDAMISGGIVPMLAHKFAEQGHKIKYPAHIQPKLDGIRCIAIVKDGECTLWSRTRKPITSMPHIIQELEALFSNEDVILDGELYNHDYKTNFEKIVSLVRQEEPDQEHYVVQYHIYDVVNGETFKNRNSFLAERLELIDEESSLKLVLTSECRTEDIVMERFELFRSMGYEGAMLRNSGSLYVNKRSYDLQKVKEFDDAEFIIVGIEEGRGKLAGHVGAFVCRTENGKEFLAKMSGDLEKLREYFNDHSLWSGKLLTVQFQGLTSYGIPRFPVGLRFRDNT
jgi:DNA ligase 1